MGWSIMGRPRKLDGSGPTAERITATAAAARTAADMARDDREARDNTLFEADAAGYPLRELARLSGMSVSHVQRIVMRETARRQNATVDALQLG